METTRAALLRERPLLLFLVIAAPKRKPDRFNPIKNPFGEQE